MNTTVTVLKTGQEEPRGGQDADEDREQDLEEGGGRVCGAGLEAAPALLGLLTAVSCWPSSLGPNCAVLLGCGSLEEPRADSRPVPLQKPSKHKKKKHKKDKEERPKDKRKSKKKVPPTDEGGC